MVSIVQRVLVLVGVDRGRCSAAAWWAWSVGDREVVVGERVEAQRRVEEVAAVGVRGVHGAERRRVRRRRRDVLARPAASAPPPPPVPPPAAAHRRGSRAHGRLRAVKRVRPRRALGVDHQRAARAEDALPGRVSLRRNVLRPAGRPDRARLGDPVAAPAARRAEPGRRGEPAGAAAAGPARARSRAAARCAGWT